MKFVTFAIKTPLGEVRRLGVLQQNSVLDIAAIYTWQLLSLGVYEAEALARAILPDDMVAFLSRWPLARAAAEEAVKFIDDQPLSACSPLGARVAYSANEYRLCTPL